MLATEIIMAESEILLEVNKPFAVPKKLRRSISRRAVRKYKRNKSRRLRMQRSKLRYKDRLQHSRLQRQSEELCASVAVCDITDMDTMNPEYFIEPLQEVAEWQNKHQIAYWKARVVALEYENRMLHEHLRNAYARQIHEYAQSKNQQQLGGANVEAGSGEEDVGGVEEGGEEEEECEEEEDKTKLPPRENAAKEKKKEMIRLYGEMAPKIVGMETAMQLNYDFQIDKHNPVYWPNIPLNI